MYFCNYLVDKDSCKSSFLTVKQFVHIQSIKKFYLVYLPIIYFIIYSMNLIDF